MNRNEATARLQAAYKSDPKATLERVLAEMVAFKADEQSVLRVPCSRCGAKAGATCTGRAVAVQYGHAPRIDAWCRIVNSILETYWSRVVAGVDGHPSDISIVWGEMQWVISFAAKRGIYFGVAETE